MHSLLPSSAHLQAAVHTSLLFLHEQLTYIQPPLQPHETISLQACGIGGKVSRFGMSWPSTIFHPMVAGDGNTGFGMTDCLHTIA